TAIPGEGAAFMLLTRAEGPSPQYGYINNVSWGNTSAFKLPKDDTVIIGADGHRICGHGYTKILQGANKHRIKAFSTIIGSVPSGQMFDIVLASLASRNRLLPDRFCSIKANQNQDLGVIYASSYPEFSRNP
ncbi:MAG: hypothetical protein KAH23_09885, partial [Kiritimatiellae bacterium]|nr:hypothetical protein [Kiritimatiellia bacterium]